MKRFLISAVLLLLTSTVVNATWVSTDEARDKADAFFNMDAPSKIRTMSAVIQVWPLTRTLFQNTKGGQDSGTPLYVFNRIGGGYVLVSGSDKTSPVLGYSKQGSFRTDGMPENILWFIRQYESFVKAAEADGSLETDVPQVVTAGYGSEDVVKYETALWNQDEPYNLLCPVFYGRRSVTGCANTALAIIMKYHRWPKAGDGDLPGYKYGSRAIQGHSLGDTYDWDSMPLKYVQGGYNDTEAGQISRLMYDLGVMNRSEYDPDGTGTIVNYIPDAVSTYMGYSKDARLIFAQSYSSSEWVSMVRQQLIDIGPLMMGGSGHSFVLDGFDDNGFFSFNFGWGGANNGYFSLVPIPGYEDRYTSFTRDLHIILNLYPDYSTEVNIRQGGTSLSSDWNYSRGETFNVKYETSLENQAHTSIQTSIGFGVVDAWGTIKENVGESIPFDVAAGSSVNLSGVHRCTISGKIEAGDMLRLIFKHPHTGEWKMVPGQCSGLALGDETDVAEAMSIDYDIETGLLTVSMPGTAHCSVRENGVPLPEEYNSGTRSLAVPRSGATFGITVSNYFYSKDISLEFKPFKDR